MRCHTIALLCLCLSACSDSRALGSEAATLPSEVRVGFANESPFAYSEAGKLTGEAPEIARRVLARMGVAEVKGVLTEFGSLVPGLRAKRFELIAAGMYVTPERCRQVAFSEPTYCVSEALLVRQGNPLGLHSYEDIAKHQTARLGVTRGTAEHGYAERLGISSERIVIFPDPPSALSGLASARIDAFAGTALTVNELLRKLGVQSQLERASPFTDPVIGGKAARGCGAFVFRPSDAALRDAFNRHLARFLGSKAHLELVSPFGFTAAELPGPGDTTESLCRP
jgi:polar amino acid transport system substrate-binding protein